MQAAGRSLQPYAHLGTGNYHPRTARMYTDFGLLTANADICADVSEVFLHITSLAKANKLKHLLARAVHHASPPARRDPARDAAREGRQAGADHRQDECADRGGRHQGAVRRVGGGRADRPDRARRLRAAAGRRRAFRRTSACARSSAAFSSITACGTSRTTAARTCYLASADWMGRNLFRRVEVAFPVLDRALKARVIDEGAQALSVRQLGRVGAGRGRQLSAPEAEGPRPRRSRRSRGCSTVSPTTLRRRP